MPRGSSHAWPLASRWQISSKPLSLPPLPATGMAMWTACRSVRGAARGSSTHSRRTGSTASRSLTSIFGNYPRGVENETTVVVLIDRKEVFRQKVGGEADLAFVDRGGGAPAGEKLMERFANIPVQVTAGVHEVVVTFIERSRVATDDLIAAGNQYQGFLSRGICVCRA